MKTITRKITALLIASATAASMSINAYASEVEENDLVQIGEYECYVEDGQYYTEIDGKTYLVIDLSEGAVEDESLNTSFYATNWQNGPVVDISNGSTYSDTINASQADDCTPIIQGRPTKAYTITAASLWGANRYKVIIHFFLFRK